MMMMMMMMRGIQHRMTANTRVAPPPHSSYTFKTSERAFFKILRVVSLTISTRQRLLFHRFDPVALTVQYVVKEPS